ncbi:cob(I)yrinic acid a,c-diamide adenosyltransferase [Alkalithermobacter paradoxus]|uniref:Corrinoid adenosyltransferase n=1 Tax=Alkalithermobacter paradoxus TaxID=29349 RepID=A0A1V4IA71_9FIRM|nr:Cob(I)yrinic acid a,c-diamide adenosyltransferase [[Clostridium] thermoalcaliphilum]
MKIYTKTGDKGQTLLYDGVTVDKDDIRVESYGTIDELNSYIGLARSYVRDENMNDVLLRIQKKLFLVAAQLATKDEDLIKNPVLENDVEYLENIIDEYLSKVDRPDAFIVPGTSKDSGILHVARTVCRRAERRILTLNKKERVSPTLIKYMNRLSDVIYTLARCSEDEIIYMDFGQNTRNI